MISKQQRQGRFSVGTTDNGLSQPLGSLYRVDPSGVVTKVDQGFVVSNSLTTSPDGKTLYFSDSKKYVLGVDLDADSGHISHRRVFFDHSADKSRPMGHASTPMAAYGTRYSRGIGLFGILRPEKLID